MNSTTHRLMAMHGSQDGYHILLLQQSHHHSEGTACVCAYKNTCGYLEARMFRVWVFIANLPFPSFILHRCRLHRHLKSFQVCSKLRGSMDARCYCTEHDLQPPIALIATVTPRMALRLLVIEAFPTRILQSLDTI
jgi:hypothetical protein